LKASPETVGINRPLNVPPRRVKSDVPPCERTFDKIHSRDGD
jgi:hypothetical protein